jgi:L-asparaginase
MRHRKPTASIVTQGTDTLEETSFLLDLLVERDIPVIVTRGDAQSRAYLAGRAGQPPRRRACRLRSLGEGTTRGRWVSVAVMLDEIYAAADVQKVHPTRLNAFASPQTGPLAALVEDRVVPLSMPVRAPVDRGAQAKLGTGSEGTEQPDGPAVDVDWTNLDTSLDAADGRSAPDQLGYRGAVDGVRWAAVIRSRARRPRLWDNSAARGIPTVVSPRAGGGPLLRQTYGGPSSEMALREAGLIWGGRLQSPEGAGAAGDLPARRARSRPGDRRGVRGLWLTGARRGPA